MFVVLFFQHFFLICEARCDGCYTSIECVCYKEPHANFRSWPERDFVQRQNERKPDSFASEKEGVLAFQGAKSLFQWWMNPFIATICLIARFFLFSCALWLIVISNVRLFGVWPILMCTHFATISKMHPVGAKNCSYIYFFCTLDPFILHFFAIKLQCFYIFCSFNRHSEDLQLAF